VALIIGTVELIGVLGDRAQITSGPLAAIGAIPLDHAGYGIVALFVVSWLIALAVWLRSHRAAMDRRTRSSESR
jgi:high-affinity nickel-transport protein